MNDSERISLQEIIDAAIRDMELEAGRSLGQADINLAELERRTGLSRSKLRTIQQHGFRVIPHGRCGWKKETTVISAFADTVDGLLMQGVVNCEVIYDRIAELGYPGGLTTVKNYAAAHRYLIPAKRQLVTSSRGRGQRFSTGPGEAFQMDWGFVNVEDGSGDVFRIACFAMVCHHCGSFYLEFFPNARQENLFIGMIHGFMVLGIPEYVLTDNMRSVVNGRDMQGDPIWQTDYGAFMAEAGFKTRLCKPYHPFTKGKVERLIRFIKENFLSGRRYTQLTDLNYQALEWCHGKSGKFRRALGCVPAAVHEQSCLPRTSRLDQSQRIAEYLCPVRSISFDGFVSYEGRRFGVPYSYEQKYCRVNRDGEWVHIYSLDLSRELAAHPVTWSHEDRFCEGQYAPPQPAELPSAPVTTTITKLDPPRVRSGFERFDFGGDF